MATSEYKCENCHGPIKTSSQQCEHCDFPTTGSKPERIAYNTKVLRFKDLVEESDKSVKGILSLAIIFAAMGIVVMVFSWVFSEDHSQNALLYFSCAVIYFLLNRLGGKSAYIMAILALFFYLGHTILEFSMGFYLKSPVNLEDSFTESKGSALFFALIPLGYLLFRLALMIILARYLLTQLKLRRSPKIERFVRSTRVTEKN